MSDALPVYCAAPVLSATAPFVASHAPMLPTSRVKHYGPCQTSTYQIITLLLHFLRLCIPDQP